MSGDQQRIRKSLAALTGTDERAGYFYCLKLLGILPPPPGSGFDQWTFFSLAAMDSVPDNVVPNDLYIPKCLHDVLVASHATSCEHGSLFFSFYHRHLMILTEIFLNFAHKILRGGRERLLEAYPLPTYDFLYNKENSQLWDSVFTVYKNFKGIPDQIANHYWNPTNYQVESDLRIPDELSIRSFSKDPIDVLFLNINKSYPWEIHVPRRWYSDESLYNFKDIASLFSNSPVVYTEKQKKFFAGQLDPRYNQNEYTNGRFLIGISNAQGNMISYRNYQAYSDSKRNYTVNNIPADESQARYGAKNKNLQYITPEEQKKFNISPQTFNNYNNAIPHYQYANALFNLDMKNFIESSYGGQRSHNYLHNNFGYILSDSTFSVTSLVFWPYHSWIDAQIEFKMRRANAKGNEADQDYLRNTLNNEYTAMPSTTRQTLSKVFNTISEDMEPMSNWRLSGDDQIDPQSAGIYPVLQWVLPTIKQVENQQAPQEIPFSPAFCSRDFVLTKTNVRNSFQFQQIYRKYIQLYAKRFAFFRELSTFNYNYNYQIGSNPGDLTKYLDEFAENVPEYLLKMQNTWLAQNIQRTNAIRVATSASFNESAKDLKEDVEFEAENSLEIRKLFQSGIELFASYTPFTKNGSYPVVLRLKNLLSAIHKKLSERDLNDLERYIHQGILVHDIVIFGKADRATTCHKCIENKAVFEDLDEALRVRTPRIWQHLHEESLNEVLFETGKNVKPKCIYNKLNLVENPIFADYRLVHGAEELVIDVSTNILTKEAKFIRLDAHTFSVSKNKIHSVLSKKEFTFRGKFDFYKIHDVDNDNDRVYFDRYAYRVLKGWISVGDQREKFEVEIPNYQRLLRLTLQVSRVEGKLHLKLVDKDFHAKKIYYAAAGRVDE